MPSPRELATRLNVITGQIVRQHNNLYPAVPCQYLRAWADELRKIELELRNMKEESHAETQT